MPEQPSYHEHLLDASDVCLGCLRVVRVERLNPHRRGNKRTFETHHTPHPTRTVEDYGPALDITDERGDFCDRCGTEDAFDRPWDDHRRSEYRTAAALGWLFDCDDKPDCHPRELSRERFHELIQNTIETLEEKGVSINRQKFAEEALRAREQNSHADDCLGEATEAAITAAITRDDTADPDEDTRREVPA